MKPWSALFLRSCLAASALLVATSGRLLAADSGATVRVRFSDSSKPGTLKLALPWAEARVTAVDGDEVVVSSSLEQKGGREVDSEGFRRLDDEVTFELVEKNNVATIVIAGDNPWIAPGAEFDIQVPRNTNLILRTEAGGDIDVNGVEGDIDISSMNGEVTLRDISSSAVVNTMNGEVRAIFAKAPVKPVSISSMNGEIDLRLPADTKANLRMRTHNGAIRTNFPADILQTKTEKVSRAAPATRAAGSRNADDNNNNDDDDNDDSARDRGRTEADRLRAHADREMARAERDAARSAAQSIRAATDAARVAVDIALNGVHPGTAPAAPIPPIPPLPNFGGKSIVGTLNGGGVDIKLTSMNGTITLRESK